MYRTVFSALLATLVLASTSGQNTPALADENDELDIYQVMRQKCQVAGEDRWAQCRQTANPKDFTARNSCDDTQERARRMCFLSVMERQHRDIHGADGAVAQ